MRSAMFWGCHTSTDRDLSCSPATCPRSPALRWAGWTERPYSISTVTATSSGRSVIAVTTVFLFFMNNFDLIKGEILQIVFVWIYTIFQISDEFSA